MYHGLRYNIVDVINQFLCAYKDLISELQIFIKSSTKSTNTTNFI